MKKNHLTRMILFQLSSIGAFFCFSWPGLILGIVMYTLSGLGITVGYHRLLTHKSFKTYKFIQRLFGFLGVLAYQRGPVFWVAHHRLHHRYPDDKDRDPHSPNKSFFWAHMGWIFSEIVPKDRWEEFAPDMYKDPFFRFIDKHYHTINIGLMLGCFFITSLFFGWYMGFSLTFWGFILRITLFQHATFFVNSAAHTWGYINYKVNDRSKNNWWVALLTFGEGWHNNHHADGRAARYGRRWFELDISYMVIKLLEKLGLAWSIQPVQKAFDA